MNTSGIETLLGKYYEGNTSLQEEKILRDFFMDKDVPAHLKLHQPLFTYCGEEQQEEIRTRDFEKKLTAQLTHEVSEIPVVHMGPARNRLVYLTGIAASIVLLAGLFFTFQYEVFKGSKNSTGNPDREIAYANATEALMMVSGNLNNGLKQVEHLQMLEKAMDDMQLFNKFYQAQTIIINPDEISNQSIKSK
jgi:hypothetical protein